jgi:hypothetical protein
MHGTTVKKTPILLCIALIGLACWDFITFTLNNPRRWQPRAEACSGLIYGLNCISLSAFVSLCVHYKNTHSMKQHKILIRMVFPLTILFGFSMLS